MGSERREGQDEGEKPSIFTFFTLWKVYGTYGPHTLTARFHMHAWLYTRTHSILCKTNNIKWARINSCQWKQLVLWRSERCFSVCLPFDRSLLRPATSVHHPLLLPAHSSPFIFQLLLLFFISALMSFIHYVAQCNLCHRENNDSNQGTNNNKRSRLMNRSFKWIWHHYRQGNAFSDIFLR